MEASTDEVFERVRRIAAKSAIARIMAKYRMSTDPLDDAEGSNSLIRHIHYLTRCKIDPQAALGVISNPKTLQLSLEMRKQAADPIRVAQLLMQDSRTAQTGSLSLLVRIVTWLLPSRKRLGR
jgi:hypothetical protein